MYFSDNHIKNRSHLQAFCPSMAIRTTRESDNKNKARRESLREPRHDQNVFGNACNNVANAKKFFGGLATVLQTPKSFSGDLQRCCKRQKVFRGTCNGVASDKKYFSAFAELPRGISKNTLLVTTLYPSHSSGIRSLILSFKLTLQRFLEREIRRRGHPFRSDRSFRGYTLLRSISEVPI